MWLMPGGPWFWRSKSLSLTDRILVVAAAGTLGSNVSKFTTFPSGADDCDIFSQADPVAKFAT